MKKTFLLAVCASFLTLSFVNAADEPLKPLSMKVGDATRDALIYVPPTATKTPTPVVFVFHGHGGNMNGSSKSFHIHTLWPEAICVYPQGLLTPSRSDPEGKRSGWQTREGQQNDRDLKYFDELLGELKKKYQIDPKRIYATGHSNGGFLTYLLWSARGDVLAAVAPSAASGGGTPEKLQPKPCLHLAGQKDPLVAFDRQQEMMARVRKLNECKDEGTSYGDAGKLTCTVYPSKIGTPFVSAIHPGGHEFLKEAPTVIGKFFKENAKP